MSTYTIEQLRNEGPQFAMTMLLACIDTGEAFVTYGDIRTELEYQLNIKKIFPTQIGYVAGALMEKILELDPKAPLINVLITRPNGIPGKGAGGYLARRYHMKKLNDWDNVTSKIKKNILELEREKIFKYPNWIKISDELFGKLPILKQKISTEIDYPNSNNNYGGLAESEEHKKLKHWVANNPRKIGLRKAFGLGTIESRLLSGDVVDVLFSDGYTFNTVEVKSCRSNDEDLKRGLYQCVKYREVKKAEHLPYDINVQSILITERELNPELKERAKLLKVKWICVHVNK